MNNIFQLTAEDIERSSTLEASDLGLWCFTINGCIFGFARTREAAVKLASQVALRRMTEG